jgi:hypothetical protein
MFSLPLSPPFSGTCFLLAVIIKPFSRREWSGLDVVLRISCGCIFLQSSTFTYSIPFILLVVVTAVRFASVGRITQVIGAVADVKFDGELPPMKEMLLPFYKECMTCTIITWGKKGSFLLKMELPGS